jgi:hypothetical protein
MHLRMHSRVCAPTRRSSIRRNAAPWRSTCGTSWRACSKFVLQGKQRPLVSRRASSSTKTCLMVSQQTTTAWYACQKIDEQVRLRCALFIRAKPYMHRFERRNACMHVYSKQFFVEYKQSMADQKRTQDAYMRTKARAAAASANQDLAAKEAKTKKAEVLMIGCAHACIMSTDGSHGARRSCTCWLLSSDACKYNHTSRARHANTSAPLIDTHT